MNESSEKILIDLLVDEGIFTREEYNNAAKTRLVHQINIREFLSEKNLASEQVVLQVLSKTQGYPIADINRIKATPDMLSKISLIQASTFGIFPLRQDGDDYILGIVDVLNSDLFDDMRFSLDFNFKLELISSVDHQKLIHNFYSEDSAGVASLEIDRGGGLDEDLDDDVHQLDESINDAPVVKLLNSILLQAINDHASDIHFEPFENEFKIRYRIDGTLYEMIPPPRHLAESVLSRIKVMARMNIAEKRVPQDGRISLRINKKNIDLRVSTLPTAFGESAVLRILDRSHIQLELDKLGLSRDMLESIREIIHKPNGIFITTGPTGAGKTTTLYSCLRELNTIDSKVITTEDPVEYDIEGLTQVPINENIGLTFAACLKSILRQDPDRIMVGEIRDLPTMNMAIQASLTGHLVLTTLHTNDAASAITRLIDMGVEPFLLCSALEGILAQRLVRKVCDNCKEPFSPSASMLELIQLKPDQIGSKQFFHGKGCSECGGLGYKGRLGVYELLMINNDIRRLIMKKTTAKMIKNMAAQYGLVTLMDDGIQKIEAGFTTIEEVASVANQD